MESIFGVYSFYGLGLLLYALVKMIDGEHSDEHPCPYSKDGHGHCVHWWDNESCCWCNDPACKCEMCNEIEEELNAHSKI